MSEREGQSKNKEFIIKATVVPTEFRSIKTEVLDSVYAETPQEAKDIFTAMVSDCDYMPEKFHFVLDKDVLVRLSESLR